MTDFNLHIDGMHCAACIRRVTQTLSTTPGVSVQAVLLGHARLSAAHIPASVDLAVAALAKAGFPAHLEA
jgi:copper chaperone CopZ